MEVRTRKLGWSKWTGGREDRLRQVVEGIREENAEIKHGQGLVGESERMKKVEIRLDGVDSVEGWVDEGRRGRERSRQAERCGVKSI